MSKTFEEFSNELPENTTPALTDEVVGLQGGINKRTTLQKIIPVIATGGESMSNIINIDNNSNTDVLTDYQIRVDVTYNSNMNADFSDLRFWDIYDTTPLDYWIQSKVDGVSAIVWVKVPFIPASSSTKIIMKYGDAFAESESDGAATFPLGFDDFINQSHHQFPMGSDGGWASGFDPVSRRFFFFGLASDLFDDYRVSPWVNIDTWEVGYVQPPFIGNSMGVVYHPVKKKFYIYGGFSNYAAKNWVWSFDPATEVYTQLAETTLVSAMNQEPCYDPVSGKIFIFGGRLTLNPNTFTDTISIHDVDAGTIIDTGANLFAASDGPTPTYSVHDQMIYLFGGAYNTGGPGTTVSTAKIHKYNPATPSINPVYTGTDMADARDTRGVAYHNGNFYLFGGYSYNTTIYTTRIEKYSAVTNTIQTITPKLYHADDDMVAFFDPINDRVYIGPLLHLNGTGNEDDNAKVCVNEFDPNNDFLYPPTPFNILPTGWLNESNSTNRPRLVGNTWCTFADYSAATFVAMKRPFTALSGVVRVDARVALGGGAGMSFIVAASEADVTGPTHLAKSAFRMRADTNLNFLAKDTVVAPIGTGVDEWSMILNFNNDMGYGLLNNANKSAAITFMNASAGKTINTIYISTGTGTIGAGLVDWVRVRNSTTGIEPTATIE